MVPRFVNKYNTISLKSGEIKRVSKIGVLKERKQYEEITRIFFQKQTFSVQADLCGNAVGTDIWVEILASQFDTSMSEEDTLENMTDIDTHSPSPPPPPTHTHTS